MIPDMKDEKRLAAIFFIIIGVMALFTKGGVLFAALAFLLAASMNWGRP